MALSKPFVVATEGPTVDGRNISREWIVSMAEKYDPKIYSSVADLEHYLSPLPDSTFCAQGKVVSLSTREVEIFGEKKLQLMAVVDANDSIVSLQKAGKKAFASVDVIPNFLGKGFAYLRRLAFTDAPASIGTESMKFSEGGASIERYGSANEIELEFEAESKPGTGELFFTKVKDLLGLNKKDVDARFADIGQAVEAIAQSQKDLLDKFSSDIEPIVSELSQAKSFASADDVKALQEAQKKFAADFAALQQKLGTTDADTEHRGQATGGDGTTVKTDC